MIAQKQQENYTTITGTNREEKNMENCKIVNLYNLDETIAKDLLLKFTYPWEALPHIKDYILEFGNTLPKEEYRLAISIIR